MATPPECHRRVSSLLLVTLIGAVSLSIAGGPRAVNGLGQPMTWNTAGAVVYNPDPGPLGLSEQRRGAGASGRGVRRMGRGARRHHLLRRDSLLGLDVNGTGFAFTNPAHYQNFYRVNGDGKSPVIFDNDGSIIESIFGIGARFEILGRRRARHTDRRGPPRSPGPASSSTARSTTAWVFPILPTT